MKDNQSKIKQNNLKKREFILSPIVVAGKDRECTNKDFLQESNDLAFLGKLGQGIKVNHKETKVAYSIKAIPKEKMIKANLQKKINKILELMYNSTHPYLLRLLNHYEDDDRLYLIFETSGDESLFSKLSTMPSDDELLKYFIQVLIGVKHLHSFEMVNININPDLIIIDEDNLVKMTDYGWNMSNMGPNSRQTFSLSNGFVINAYTSPEELNAIIKKTKPVLTKQKDSWNLGVLLYELFSYGYSPFQGNTVDQFVQNIFNCEVDLTVMKNPKVKELITRLLVVDEQKRMTVDELIQYDYFKSIEIDMHESDNNDSIINPQEPTETSILKPFMNNNYDYDSMMSSLKTENEQLKKVLNQYRQSELMMNDEWKQSFLLNFKQSTITDANNNEDIDNEKENEDKDTPLTDLDIITKEKLLEDKILMLSQENDIDEDVKLNSQIRQLNNQIDLLNGNYEEERESNAKLEAQITQLEENNSILEEKLKFNSYDIVDSKATEVKNNDNALISTLKTFEESLTLFKELADKLLIISRNEHNALMTKSNKYLEEKGVLFNELLSKMKEVNDKDNTAKKQEIGSFDCKQSQIEELIEYKAKLRALELKEEKLNEKIRLTKEKNNLNEKMNEVLALKNRENEKRNQKLRDENDNYKQRFRDIKHFIDDKVTILSSNFIEDFYLKFKI